MVTGKHQLTIAIMGDATVLRVGSKSTKTMLRADRAKFFGLYSVCDILGYISHKRSQQKVIK